ncbi:glycosyltransferase [Thalassospira sp. GB04J01]|uniref:glycosyltransferase n=1 Tax=Thalassospira sp. GB04J01 TaxID=1485225 RepID=UPI0011AECB75|nr:glycosyltransferase [Thalassospira sp. GB04J01]
MVDVVKKKPKITYLVKGGRQSRLLDAEAPSELLYGYRELQGLGLDMGMLADREFDLDVSPNFLKRYLNTLLYWIVGIPGWSLWRLYLKRKLFEKSDVVVVTTNTFGVCLAVLLRLKLLPCKLIFIAMGLVEASTPKRWQVVYRWALANCGVLALAQRDAEALSTMIGREVPYIPFGVDFDFWGASIEAQTETVEKYILSIGNDRHRDYSSLVQAWRPWFPKLKIVTKLEVSPQTANVEVIHGDWHRQALSDIEIRRMVNNAICTILPIRDTVQPSGQSTALQSMACGKAVLLTDFAGLWNKDFMISGQTCVFIGKPGCVKDISDTVSEFLDRPRDLEEIGRNAREVVAENLNCKVMAKSLMRFIEIHLAAEFH